MTMFLMGKFAGEDFKFRVDVWCEGEDVLWIAECPDLPGCVSQGRTRDEAITQILEAIQLSLETRRDG